MAETFSTGTGELELLLAIREVQLEDAVLAGQKVGVFYVSAPREDALPYFLNAVYKAGMGNKRLTGRDSLRTYTIEMKAVAAQDELEAVEIAGRLAGANYALFGPEQNEDGLTARERLNAKLEPMGWTSQMPIEAGGIGPYKDNLDDLERWHIGHLFRFRISRI